MIDDKIEDFSSYDRALSPAQVFTEFLKGINTPRLLLDATNAERKARSLPALEMDEALMDGASEWAGHMYGTKRLKHASLDGFNGENIAWNQSSIEDVIRSWMGSPGHRRNILSKGFTKAGVGFCGEPAEDGSLRNVYWVQRFK